MRVRVYATCQLVTLAVVAEEVEPQTAHNQVRLEEPVERLPAAKVAMLLVAEAVAAVPEMQCALEAVAVAPGNIRFVILEHRYLL